MQRRGRGLPGVRQCFGYRCARCHRYSKRHGLLEARNIFQARRVEHHTEEFIAQSLGRPATDEFTRQREARREHEQRAGVTAINAGNS